jgi:hypothetical protein
VPLEGLEPPTLSLGRNCSSIELQRRADAKSNQMWELGGPGQIFFPVRLRAIHAPNHPGGAIGLAGGNMHPPPHFFGGAVAFEVVAIEAARHQVFPRVLASARARNHVVNGGGVALAVGAP